MTSLRTLVLALGLVGLAVGCGGPPPAPVQKITAISGKVTVGGKPVERVSLTFHPVTEGQGREESCGALDKGEYKTELITAKYKVTFVPLGTANIPKKYREKGTTPVEVDVTGGTMTKDFDLTP